ncbi:hypothetical protein BH10ACI1_BH10ACI1_19630 [soil metagenome]
MNGTLKNKEAIREYLLCRISDDKKLSEIEELLFSDDEFCAEVETVEDEIINEYVLEKLNSADRQAADEFFFANKERKWKLELTRRLRQKAFAETTETTETSSYFENLKNFFRKPAFAISFAVLIIAIVGISLFILTRKDSAELAELQTIYKQERPTEARISSFEYAPLVTVRGNPETDANKNKLRLIETKLLEALETNPNAPNHHALGVFYLTQAKFADAISELDKAVQLDPKNAKFLNDLGSAYFETAKNGDKIKKLENLARANERFSKAFELNPNFLEALFNKSLTLQELNLPNQAKESWNLYLEKDSDSKWAEEARKNLEKITKLQNISKTKEQVLEDFLAAFRNKDEPSAWKIHNETKGMFNFVSLGEQLTRRFLEARKANDETASKESLEALKFIGNLEKEKHADFFFAGLADFYAQADEKQIDKLLEAKNLRLEGYQLIQGKAEKSIELFEQSSQLFRQQGDKFEALIAELWAAQMLPDVSKINESRNRLNVLIETAERENFRVLLPTAYYWLSVCEFRQNQFSNAEQIKKKSLEISEATENFYEAKHTSESLAIIFDFLGETQTSLIFIDKALDKNISYFINPAQTGRNLSTATRLLLKTDFIETTIDFGKESLGLNREILSKTNAVNGALRELAKALTKKGQFEEALKYAEESNSIALNREESAENNGTIADSFLQKANLKSRMQNCTEALSDYDKALEFYSKIPETTFNLYNVHKGKLLCFQQQNAQSNFENELETVLQFSEEYRRNIREDTSRQAFFANEQVIFDAAITNALNNTDHQKAFEFSELSKSRSLLDFVKSGKSIAELEREFSSVAKPLSLAEIKERMPENVQIIQYAKLFDRLAIWTFSRNKFDYSEKTISAAELERKIGLYRKALLAKDSAENLRQLSLELYQILIPPNLEAGKTICLIPDKSLNSVPFASLVSDNGKFLIENFAIFYSPSASVFVLASENAKAKEVTKNESILSIGNPSFDRTENPTLADLPQAANEATEIAKNYLQSQNFIGDAATKENFLRNFEIFDIIHFAGHFVVNEQSPANSKLLFAGKDLRVFELTEKHLKKAKLVVLSACETGNEKLFDGEGAVGIARTFLAMGTPLVVASSWKVDSEATENLMINFHQNRRRKNLSSIESMRQAQLEMLRTKDFSAPFYWAAFNLVGGFANY